MPGYNQTKNRYQNGSTYDANGNLLYDTFQTHTWNVYDKMVTIITGNTTTTCGSAGTCITYDALDRPVEKNASGTKSEFFYEPASTAVMSAQTVSQRRSPMPGGATLDQIPGDSGHIWHKDWLGTSRFSSSLSGSVYFDRAFAPYGEMYDSNVGGTTFENFTGHLQDFGTSLYDTPARELHATQGRWISPDPAGLASVDPTNPQSWNPYAYVANNPLIFTDPTGLILDPQTPSCNEDASCDGGYSHDPLVCDPNDIFCASGPAGG